MSTFTSTRARGPIHRLRIPTTLYPALAFTANPKTDVFQKKVAGLATGPSWAHAFQRAVSPILATLVFAVLGVGCCPSAAGSVHDTGVVVRSVPWRHGQDG